eukprot:7936523-Ditylum_brightwellii.AAC.1
MGDMYDHKVALKVLIFLMVFPIDVLGCLPSYSQIDCLSTSLLILVLMMQGLSMGRQLALMVVFLLEQEDKKR